jgi:hypothetical protein
VKFDLKDVLQKPDLLRKDEWIRQSLYVPNPLGSGTYLYKLFTYLKTSRVYFYYNSFHAEMNNNTYDE